MSEEPTTAKPETAPPEPTEVPPPDVKAGEAASDPSDASEAKADERTEASDAPGAKAAAPRAQVAAASDIPEKTPAWVLYGGSAVIIAISAFYVMRLASGGSGSAPRRADDESPVVVAPAA